MPRTSRERPNGLEPLPRMTLSLASQDFKGKSDMSFKAASKRSPKEETSRMGPTWGYGMEVTQGKYVSFALSVPTNVLAILMRKTPEQ